MLTGGEHELGQVDQAFRARRLVLAAAEHRKDNGEEEYQNAY